MAFFKNKTSPTPQYMYKAQHMRRIIIAAMVLLVILVVCGVGLGIKWDQLNNAVAHSMTQVINEAADAQPEDISENQYTTVKTTTVPDLVSVLGSTEEQALEKIQRGAQVTETQQVTDKNSAIKTKLTVALTTEQANSRSGTPTVYLFLNDEGTVLRAGYYVATSALGFGSLSFADAITNEHIIEKTINEIGVPLEWGVVVLPEDKMEYSTYATDGTTLTREFCTFTGEAGRHGATHDWSAELLYDYEIANETGNLAYTVRTILVYVNS